MTRSELKSWLKAHNMTVRELAERLPMSRRTLETWIARDQIHFLLPRALRDVERELK